MLERRFIIQDRETRYFVGVEDGDASLVPYINCATKYDDEETAYQIALYLCGAGYVIFSGWFEYHY